MRPSTVSTQIPNSIGPIERERNPMNVLIVDDSKAMRMIVTRTLKQAGLTLDSVKEASNGQEAFDAIQESRPDLVLCDWNMPEKNGIELLQDLRDSGCDVTFGFVTSECTTEMRTEAKEKGAAFFVTKPFTADTLKTSIEGAV